jgi:hypothetical protein
LGIGKILGSVSPAFGLVSGKGLFGNKGVLGTISPLYGMISGKGAFGHLEDILGGGGLLGMLLGGGGGGGGNPTQMLDGGQNMSDDYLSSLLRKLQGIGVG